jgi:SIR2-like domain
MRRIVYLLGAGFSAPLGIPVISNFYWKAKDLYDREPEKFAHFAESFSVMESFHRVKMFMKAELENIEEILSILEMKDVLSSEPSRETFSRFICDVIKAYTPEFTPPPPALRPGSDSFSVFFGGPSSLPAAYCTFVSQLFAIRHAVMNTTPVSLERGTPEFHYSIINLNYDRVLESACEYINRHFPPNPPLAFFSPANGGKQAHDSVLLAKLHGSVDGDIVPPTWNKRIHDGIVPAWRAAFAAVAQANELRFIGYSLPETDSYFRYFLKAAISQSFNLQRVDVLCSGNVQQRYSDLFEGNRLHFRSGDTEAYLSNMRQHADADMKNFQQISREPIQAAHSRLFAT